MTEETPQEEPKITPDALAECQKKADEYLNNWKRAAADFANYKKEEIERAGLLVNYSKQDMVYKILPVLDSIHLAQNHIPDEIKNNSWMQGFLQIQSQINDFLKKEGIEEMETAGKKFDPSTMEIVLEVEEGESGTVAEELQKGYMLNGKVLRPAKVKVNK